MKRYGIFFVMFIVLLGSVFPAMAQESAADVIVIDDANPVVELFIEPVPGATGVVALEVYRAAVSVTDEMGNLLFQTVDPRIQTIELQSSPTSSAYTVTVQQLAASETSLVRAFGQADLTTLGDTTLIQSVSQTPVGLAQEVDLLLSATTPTENLNISLPSDEGGLVSVSFPGSDLGVQLMDTTGIAIATLTGDVFDGLSLGLAGGEYQLTVFDPAPSGESFAAARVMPLPSNDLAELAAAHVATVAAANTPACSITVDVSSVNLRSGPGTGYSVLGYGFRNDNLAVGGTNAAGGWYVVGYDGGSAWIGAGLGTPQGDCDALAVYNTPYREAPVAPVVVQEAEPVVVQVQVPFSGSSSSSGSSGSSGSFDNESSGSFSEASWDDNESSGSGS